MIHVLLYQRENVSSWSWVLGLPLTGECLRLYDHFSSAGHSVGKHHGKQYLVGLTPACLQAKGKSQG